MPTNKVKDCSVIVEKMASIEAFATTKTRLVSVGSSSLLRPLAIGKAASFTPPFTPPVPCEIFVTNDDLASTEYKPCCKAVEGLPIKLRSNNDNVATTKLSERQRFVLFFKILAVYMVRTTPILKEQVVIHRNLRALIKECQDEIKSGDHESLSMPDRLARKLRSYVGEQVWLRSQDCLVAFCKSRNIA